MQPKTVLWLVLLLVLLGVGIRAYHLTDRSLWFDESFSWRLVKFPFPEMIARDAADVHPPLYYIALRSWSYIFGTTLLSLRSFSVTAAALSIAAIYGFTSYAWRSRTAGLIAAALLSFSGWQIAFAWEARMYTFGILLSLLSSWALLKALREKHSSALFWMIYAIVTAAFAYTHYFAFFTIAAQALFIAIWIIRHTRWRIGEMIQLQTFWLALLAGLFMVVVYVPWIPTFLKQNSQVQASYWVPPIGGWSIPDTFYRMFIPTSGIPPHMGAGVILRALPIILTVGVWIFLAFSCRRSKQEGDTCDAASLVALSAAIPFILAIALSFVGQSIYQDRFLVFTHAFTLIAVAVVMSKIPLPAIRRTVISVACLAFIGAFILYWQELDIPRRPGARAATAYALEHRQADEPIIVSSPFVYFAAEYYAAEEFGAAADPHLYSATGELVHFAGGPILTQADLITPAEVNSQPSNTIWVIDTTGFGGTELNPGPEWQKTDTQTYPEVFAHQADVIVNKYQRQ